MQTRTPRMATPTAPTLPVSTIALPIPPNFRGFMCGRCSYPVACTNLVHSELDAGAKANVLFELHATLVKRCVTAGMSTGAAMFSMLPIPSCPLSFWSHSTHGQYRTVLGR
eukprot:1372368-Rhodomonas_salina.4